VCNDETEINWRKRAVARIEMEENITGKCIYENNEENGRRKNIEPSNCVFLKLCMISLMKNVTIAI